MTKHVDGRGRMRAIRGLRLPKVWDIGWFWSFVDIPSAEACWTWTGPRAAVGYGVFARFGYAHQISARIHHGASPPKNEVRHTCDNRLCVNPSHLLYGTRSENMIDMVRRRRHADQLMTCERVTEVRERHAAGESVTAIAKSIGVGRSAVSAAVHRRTWRHVP